LIKGVCEPEEFAKALEKIGIAIPSKKDLEMLFTYYDTDGSGALDYKEFTAILLGNDTQPNDRKS
jgi:Ca2+-binding EF-hand superfamily protein